MGGRVDNYMMLVQRGFGVINFDLVDLGSL